MKRVYLLSIIVVFCLAGCKKEPTTWSGLWTVPIVKGNLTLSNLVPDYTAENSDGYASIIFNDTAFSFSIDTLIKLPDTSLVQKTAIAFSSITLAPGAFISNNDVDQLYDLGEISLKRVIIKEGQAFIIISSPWPGKTKAVFEFPKVKDNFGNTFQRTYFLEAGSIANPFVIRDTFNIADFDFNLTGASGGLSNNLTANISMFSDEETESFTITNLDTVLLSLSFSGLKPKYARGYFGQYTITDTTEVDFPEMEALSGSLELDSLRMELNIRNGFDLIAQAKISDLYGKNTITNQNVVLMFPFLGQFLNLNPATGGLYDYEPSDYYLSLSSDNSSIIPFIENLPNAIVFGYEVKINPDGNTSAGTDQFFPNSSLDLLADAELPLCVKLADFTITDTFDIDASSIENNISEAMIKIDYTNSFPMSANAPLYLLGEDDNITDSIFPLAPILSGTYSTVSKTTSSSSGESIYELSESKINSLKSAQKIAISATFNTDGIEKIKINMSDSISFILTSDLNLKISL